MAQYGNFPRFDEQGGDPVSEPMIDRSYSSPASERQPRSRRAIWSKAEDALLLQLMAGKGDGLLTSFMGFSSSFPGKSSQQIQEHWQKVLDPSLRKGAWTHEEDQKIIQWVEQNSASSWQRLAAQMPGRIGKQLRERWQNSLDPSTSRGPFTAEEDETLIQLHAEKGPQWAVMSKIMNRSDNRIKNRWNTLQRWRSRVAEEPIVTVVQFPAELHDSDPELAFAPMPEDVGNLEENRRQLDRLLGLL
jgi:hypothetical protein